MEIIEDQLATVDEARAYQVEDVLVLQVTGSRPSACHIVTVERTLTEVEPPGFVARMTVAPNMKCAPMEQAFHVTQAFRIGVHREAVTLHDAGGERTVEVRLLDADARLAGATGDQPRVELPRHETREAVGYSRDWDLQEAMRDAIAQLPDLGIPDWLYHYTVVEVGAEIGGIAGFNRLRVTVRG